MINAGETIIKIKANGDCSLEGKAVNYDMLITALQKLLAQVIMHAFKVSEKEAREAAVGAFLFTANLSEDQK